MNKNLLIKYRKIKKSTMKKLITTTTILLMSVYVFAQKDVNLTINHKLGTKDFAFNAEAQNDLGHKFRLNRLEYYISGISIVHDGGTETKVSDIYILAKANKADTIRLGNLNVTQIESINFSVGVDPGVNNGDPAQWGSFHPLAPKSPSMHWGWASGYRFVALEGKSGNNFAQDFQIHALGNRNYFNQNIPVQGKDVNGALLITLNADYTKAVSGMDMNAGLYEHSERREAATCLRLFRNNVFTNESGEGNTLSVKEVKVENAFGAYPNPSSGSFSIQLDDNRFQSAELEIMNLLGEVIKETKLSGNWQTVSLNKRGVYFLTLKKNGLISTEKIIVQ